MIISCFSFESQNLLQAILLEYNEQEAGTPAEVEEELAKILKDYPTLHRAVSLTLLSISV